MERDDLIRYAGRAIALAWAGFWMAAGAVAGYRERGAAWDALAFAVIPGGLFLLVVAAVWKWDRIGAWAVLLCGVAILGHAALNPAGTGPVLLLAGPPLAGGLLLLLHQRAKTHGTGENGAAR